MFPIYIKLKNYRCFSDRLAADIEIAEDFTALVGPNNSGKSSILKFFHEMKNVWINIANDLPRILAAGTPLNISYVDVADPAEVLHNDNDRPLTIEITITPNKPELRADPRSC